MSLGIIIGMILASLLEYPIINFVYLSNADLFMDMLLTEKNRKKLSKCILERIEKDNL